MGTSKKISFRTVLSNVEVDTESGRVESRAGSRRLRPGCIEVLAHLVECANQTVSRQELLRMFWREPVGGEGSLAHVISDIRKALGDDGKRQQVIVTVPGTGYRLETLPPKTRKVNWKIAAGFALILSILAMVGLKVGNHSGLGNALVVDSGSAKSDEQKANTPGAEDGSPRDRAEKYLHEALEVLGEGTAHSASLAAALLQRSVEADPEFASGWAWLSISNSRYVAYFKPPQEREEEAADAAFKAFEIDPRLPETYTAIALSSGQEAAMAFHKRAMELGPQNAAVHYFAGLHMRFRDPRLAIEWLRKAYQLDPQNLNALVHIAFSYEIAGDGQSAQDVWKDLSAKLESRLVREPLSPGLLMKASVALQKSGRMAQATLYADRLLAQEPDDPMALYWLGGVFALDSQKEVAISMIDKAVKSGFHNIEALQCTPELETIRQNSRFKEALAQVDSF